MDTAQFWFQDAGGYKLGNSLRFRGAQTLSRAAAGSGTFSAWVKRGTLTTASTIAPNVAFAANGTLNGSTAVFRDPAAWMHIVVNAGNTFANGVRVGSGSAPTSGTLGTSFDGYMADVHFVDGQALAPTVFGEFNADGAWVPKKPSGLSYGTNGFHLDFSDPANIGKDRSGNNNDFTATGFQLTDSTKSDYDWVKDSPTDNYATLNPLYPGSSTSDGNLKSSNNTAKPTILGVTTAVEVAGASQSWNGTETGWTYSGEVEFGQQNFATALSTASLPNVPITKPSDHFTTILDTGANILTAAQAKFPNGLWWIKDRVNGNQLQLVDSINGSAATKQCPANTVGAYFNPAGNSIAWCWATPASGINLSAGFSITSGAHGLGAAPNFVIDRSLNVYHSSLTAGQGLSLSTRAAAAAQAWTVNATTVTGPGGGTYYAWRSVLGYSAFGHYLGNGSPDGTFVYTGFRPSFLLYKRFDTDGEWQCINPVGKPYNPNAVELIPNQGFSAEADLPGTIDMDLLSNGFKLRNANADRNASGGSFIYAAFAEHPFGGANVSPATAR